MPPEHVFDLNLVLGPEQLTDGLICWAPALLSNGSSVLVFGLLLLQPANLMLLFPRS